jgi:hypothetical protein
VARGERHEEHLAARAQTATSARCHISGSQRTRTRSTRLVPPSAARPAAMENSSAARNTHAAAKPRRQPLCVQDNPQSTVRAARLAPGRPPRCTPPAWRAALLL